LQGEAGGGGVEGSGGKPGSDFNRLRHKAQQQREAKHRRVVKRQVSATLAHKEHPLTVLRHPCVPPKTTASNAPRRRACASLTSALDRDRSEACLPGNPCIPCTAHYESSGSARHCSLPTG
jgi:hypothetical protein